VKARIPPKFKATEKKMTSDSRENNPIKIALLSLEELQFEKNDMPTNKTNGFSTTPTGAN
jgi:hypothetical protein